MKLWSGRFGKDTDALVDALNASIPFDQRLYKEDIQGSQAHAAMLAKQGIITEEDNEAIQKGLTQILLDIEKGEMEFRLDQEDIHMNIESRLTEQIGQAGKRLHTGRSRNDQVALDFRLFVRRHIPTVISQLLQLEKAICQKAAQHKNTVMPGYTHLQRAQPISFAQHLLAYGAMLKRDVTRLEDCLERLDECPLGSGALAGTTYPIDRHQTAQALGFAAPMENSLDGVSDRDYALELLSDLSILMMHLSRFSEEIILWCSWEFKFIELDDAYSTGSSIMPQKKNPDVAELVRGKTGRVYGSLITLLTVMKSLPLAYNKDMQEDKEPVFDALDTVEMCLPVFTAMIETMKVLPENMRRSAGHGFINATDCADYLTRKGLPFRDAYTLVGQLVAQCTAQNKTLEELTLPELQKASPLFEEDIYQSLNLENCMALRASYGGPAPAETSRQIENLEAFIAEHTPKEESK
ncbi:argininosuccinate lyase [Intestinimonas butyriciproducens]|uniref:argininosuccinate lyase n=1 Tax=Intestinimonas butyriciproducens TaxID=1297617 RepID=UPI0019594A10|nr:argininosuccinate lyase [Intestinimonas butyriciproducens]MBM6919481.1 argininosuccinate lyase [Intestinimonas butyriciproducens]